VPLRLISDRSITGERDPVPDNGAISRPIARISSQNLDSLMRALEVHSVQLTECLISPGWRLAFDQPGELGLHYVLGGGGQMIIGNNPPINLIPHTLIITPQSQPFVVEVPAEEERPQTAERRWPKFDPDPRRKLVAGEGKPALQLVCGCFSASISGSIDLLSAIADPIVEQFDANDGLDRELKCALAELLAREIGATAVTSALAKQVLVKLFRRSLTSPNLWVERFAVLNDPQIAQAFTEMTARPGAPHTVQRLSRMVGLSRSVFMVRFAAAFGKPPMTVLRKLRMRHAASLLATNNRSIDQVSCEVGYASRSSFFRAFRKTYKDDPIDARVASHHATAATPDEARSEIQISICR
jgi:AraC family transcriptional activator of mtrCDE